jgi:hypothetical protein
MYYNVLIRQDTPRPTHSMPLFERLDAIFTGREIDSLEMGGGF